MRVKREGLVAKAKDREERRARNQNIRVKCVKRNVKRTVLPVMVAMGGFISHVY